MNHQSDVRVTVLMGGPDREREVSLASGEQVAEALLRHGSFTVKRCVIDAPTAEELKSICSDTDVILPILHGPWGEGGSLQTALETLGIPFLGSRAQAATIAMDKAATKIIAGNIGLPTPEWEHLGEGQSPTLSPPIVLKPVDDGSSFGVQIHREQVPAMVERACLCERFVDGRELTLSVLNGEALPIIEIIPSDGFYDFAAKYDRDDTTYLLNPTLDRAIEDALKRDSIAICQRLGVRHLARVDWLLDGGGPWFLEVNTMPGMTTHSLLPMAAAEIGLDMPALCARLVDIALIP